MKISKKRGASRATAILCAGLMLAGITRLDAIQAAPSAVAVPPASPGASLFDSVASLENAAAAHNKPQKKKRRWRRKFTGLSHWVLKRAYLIGRQINRTGGYRFDGVNDCYGFMRRAWDPILRFYKKGPLPTGDYVSRSWQPIRNWNDLIPGDVLGSHQGHAWGPQWHGGLYFGKFKGRHWIYDNSGRHSMGGAYIRPLPRPGYFAYYYVPTHKLLKKYHGGQTKTTK